MTLAADAPLIAALTDFAAAHPQVTDLGLAVSGGGDSLALLHLCHLARARLGWRIMVASVDHALRPESRAEALAVGDLCRTLDLPHAVLTWDHGGDLRGNLMEEASRARYALLADWARGQGLQALLVAHTAQDQAEALLMGLARGAGLDGLCGMRPEWHEGGLLWARPLLGCGRQQLRDHLTRHGVVWMEDPSNENDRFTRARMRKALTALQDFDVSVEAIAQSAGNLALSRAALQVQVVAFAQDHVDCRHGMLELPLQALQGLDPDLQRRFLRGVLGWMGGASYAPRGPQLRQLQEALSQSRDATLAGVRFRHRPRGLRIFREPRAVQGSAAEVGRIWDHRWQVRGPSGGTVRALGQAGLQQVPGWRESKIPRDALLVSPAIWQGDRLLAAPLLGFGEKWQAELSLDLVSFLQAH